MPLKIKRQFITEKWFYNKPSLMDIVKPIQYVQSQEESLFFIKIMDFYTLKVNLLKSEEDILKNFSKNTKYEIRRASKENIKMFKLDIDMKQYIKYYSSFAKEKNLSLLSLQELSYYWNNLVILGSGKSLDNILIINTYLIDNKRARLFHSISLFRGDDSIDKKLAGMANRFLHFEAMKFFKSKGFVIYDFGGIGKNETTKTIDKFKLNFTKNIAKEYHLISPILFLLLKIKGNL